MTDSIDLDDVDVDETRDEDAPTRGDWFWRGEGDADAEVRPWADPSDGTDATDARPRDRDARADAADAPGDAPRDADAADATPHAPTPRVPREGDDRPVGIPMTGGGAGAGLDSGDETAGGETAGGETTGDADGTAPSERGPSNSAAATGGAEADARGPHGGGADDMTLAFTFAAIRRLEHLHAALADAETWTDWLGVVGDVDAHVITKFQRDNRVDVDFFNGSGTGPAERLAEIDEHSMFYADRMVLVGDPDQEDIAERAGWEFVPLAEAADGADWSLTDG